MPPGHLPDAGMEPVLLMSSALADGFFTTSATREASATGLPGNSQKHLFQETANEV